MCSVLNSTYRPMSDPDLRQTPIISIADRRIISGCASACRPSAISMQNCLPSSVVGRLAFAVGATALGIAKLISESANGVRQSRLAGKVYLVAHVFHINIDN